MREPYQLEMEERIDSANLRSRNRHAVTTELSWQDYADLLWAYVELRQYGPEKKAIGERLQTLARLTRDALDRANIPKPADVSLPPRLKA